MRIKKTYRSAVQQGKVLNEKSTSQDNTYSCDYLNGGLDYSTGEIKTGGTWIDGKPIYRKVVNFGVLPNTNTKSVNHNISNIKNVIKIDGIFSKQNFFAPMPASDTLNIAYQVKLYMNNESVVISTANDRSDCSAYIILEYTKN